jgi:hypothetical protein
MAIKVINAYTKPEKLFFCREFISLIVAPLDSSAFTKDRPWQTAERLPLP